MLPPSSTTYLVIWTIVVFKKQNEQLTEQASPYVSVLWLYCQYSSTVLG